MFPQILALGKDGIPMQWITYEDAAIYYAKDLVAWEHGNSFTIHGGWSRAYDKRTTMDIKNIIAVNGINANKFYNRTPALTNRALFARDKYICAYCGDEHILSKLTRDHVHPLSKGGVNEWKNCVTACRRCNNKKADRDIDDINMKLLYVPYTPDKAEHLILLNRRILDDQMDYLKKMISNQNSRWLI